MENIKKFYEYVKELKEDKYSLTILCNSEETKEKLLSSLTEEERIEVEKETFIINNKMEKETCCIMRNSEIKYEPKIESYDHGEYKFERIFPMPSIPNGMLFRRF